MGAPERLIRAFCHAPRSFMAAYGANVGGFFWNAGTALQFVFGMIAVSPREIASSAFNVASPCSFLFFGHRNWGVVMGGIFGLIGTFLAVSPQLGAGEAGSVFGFMAYCVFVLLSIFSAPLTRRFGEADNIFVRAILGEPRRTTGLGNFFLARLPIIFESVMHARLHLAAVFAVWALGDLAFSFFKTGYKAIIWPLKSMMFHDFQEMFHVKHFLKIGY